MQQKRPEVSSFSLRASYSLSIGLKTISYCHSSHMRTIVTVPVNPPLSNQCQKGQKATTLSMLNLSSRFKPPKNSTWPCLSGNPPHFIQEMKTKVYDAIDFYEFLPSLWDSCPQKSLIGAPYSTLETRLAHFPYVIRETSSLSNLLSSLVEFW